MRWLGSSGVLRARVSCGEVNMGVFRFFKKRKPGAKPALVKSKSRSARTEPAPPKAEKKRIPGVRGWGSFLKGMRFPRRRMPWWLRLVNWREIPRWGKALIVLGGVGVGMAIWFAILSSLAPPPEYRLSVTANPTDGGQVSLSPSYDDYSKGTQVTLAATPSAEYEFVSWSGDASGTSPTITVTMDSDREVIANFRIIRYALTAVASPPGGGLVSPSAGTYDIGTQVTLAATPSAEYEFVSWSGDASGRSPTITVTMDSDREVTANFRISRYTLTAAVSPPGGGLVSPSVGTYDSGTQVTLAATPSAEYEFVSWSGDASGTSPTVTITMDSDKEVTANFVATFQEIRQVMPTGISGSAVVYTNDLERGETIEGFVELTGEYRGQDWSFDWTFELINPEGRKMDYWEGHWVRNNHHDFSFAVQYSGTYKLRVRHNSLYDKDLVIRIKPKGWS
jgi:uncharacterized repeat protein (TIGR02543 family)